MVIISFCITVYNQIDLLKNCLESIIQYNGDDIEVIISDDMSTENIRHLLKSYNDKRIKYFVNETNLGHDRNILNALMHATGKYAFVLRTRDCMIPEAIKNLVYIAKSENSSYITTGALNQDGDVKLKYTKLEYKSSSDAIEAHYKLFIHPSGNMYRLVDLDLDLLKKFFEQEKLPKNAFIIHNMIRLQLATAGGFRLINEPTWIYTDTEKALDVAVNKGNNKVCVYDPIFAENRFIYEQKWSNLILKDDLYYYNFLKLVSIYLYQATWAFKLDNSDKQSQHHYNYEYREFSFINEVKRFRKICINLYDKRFAVSQYKFFKDVNYIFKRNKILGFIKYNIRALTYRSCLYRILSLIYKKYIKKI